MLGQWILRPVQLQFSHENSCPKIKPKWQQAKISGRPPKQHLVGKVQGRLRKFDQHILGVERWGVWLEETE